MHASEGSVRSGDGVSIGFTRIGHGPALVLVHGSLSDGDDWRKVVSLLTRRFTCYIMDRRGRGRSGDAPEYSIEREYEDVAAVIKYAGPGASVIAHSFGAICALGAALRIPVASLVLYEPPIPVNGPVAGLALEEYRAAIDRGALDEALEIGLRRFSRMTEEEIARVRQGRLWMKQRTLSPTWVRELEAIDQHGPGVERYRDSECPHCYCWERKVRRAEAPPKRLPLLCQARGLNCSKVRDMWRISARRRHSPKRSWRF